jgi:transcriptional regulator with XRE-family HTH domain
MALTANEWAAQIAKQVGQGVAHYRGQARDSRGGKLTAQALADRCAGLGLPMDRTVIAKLEKGTRQTITVGELIVLSRALNIPPVQLLFPIGRETETEVFPGESVDTWEALKWFTGEQELIPTSPLDNETKTQDAEGVRFFREHDRLVDDWWDYRKRLSIIADTKRESLRRFRSEADPDAVDEHMMQLTSQRLREIEADLRELREEMQSAGYAPPEIGPSTSFLADLPSPGAPGAPVDLASIPMEPLSPESTEDKPLKEPEGNE